MTIRTHVGESGELQLGQEQGDELNQKGPLRCDAPPARPPEQTGGDRREVFLLLKSIVLQLGGALILNMGTGLNGGPDPGNLENINLAVTELKLQLGSMAQCEGAWGGAVELAEIAEQLRVAVGERWTDGAAAPPKAKTTPDNEAHMLSLMWQLIAKARAIDSSMPTILVNLDAACCNGGAQ